MPLGEAVNKFQELFVRNLVARSAENAFKGEVRKFCTHFQAEHVKLAAESGKPFSEIIAMSGYKVQPTPVDKLNPWQRYLISLPDQRLIELVKEATSPAHGQMLDKYPSVAYGLVRAIKSMVVSQG